MAVKMFGRRLSQTIKEKGWSQEKFAEIIQVHPSAVSQYVTGTSMPEGKFLLVIADVLGVSLNYLYGRTDVRDVNMGLPLPPPPQDH
jgi:transcriptional regulator with XRE-family HTH domain